MGVNRAVITPYWFQNAAIQALFEFFARKPDGAPLIGLPTGTGKSVVIAVLIQRILQMWPDRRILMLTHVKELIGQNAERLLEVWPHAPVGIYSAGLKRRDVVQPILFGGIQSLYKKIDTVGKRHILMVDEAHLIGTEESAMYLKAIAGLKAMNPDLIIMGFTATLYRMGLGALTNGGIFTDVAFDMTDMAGFNRLVAEGFLSPLIAKPTQTEMSLKGVKLVGGEFNMKQAEALNDVKELTVKMLSEYVDYGVDRHKWLIFANGISSAEHINDLLNGYFNVPSVVIHSKVKDAERATRLEGYENDTYRCAVNNNVMTVGYDHRPIDYIGMMRLTNSTGLHVQMAGRGTRISPETGKINCMYMDFAANVRRLGPINDPRLPNKKGEGGGDAPVRICEVCNVYNHAAARFCFACGHEFTFKEKLFGTARTDEILRTEAAVVESFEVTHILYVRHIGKKTGIPCIRAEYICGFQSFKEYVLLDAPGGAGHMARDWWRLRMPMEPPTPKTCHPFPTATDAALSCTHQFRKPRMIRVHTNTQYPTIQSVEF